MLGLKSIIDKNIIFVGGNFTDIFIYNSNSYEIIQKYNNVHYYWFYLSQQRRSCFIFKR